MALCKYTDALAYQCKPPYGRTVLRSWQNFQRAQTSGTGHPAFSDTADVAARPAAERREQLDALHVLQVSAAEPCVCSTASAARFNSCSNAARRCQRSLE